MRSTRFVLAAAVGLVAAAAVAGPAVALSPAHCKTVLSVTVQPEGGSVHGYGKCPHPHPSASASVSTAPSGSPSGSPTPSQSAGVAGTLTSSSTDAASPSAVAGGVVVLPAANLPTTGGNVPLIAGAGLALFAVGAVLYAATRRRRTRFET